MENLDRRRRNQLRKIAPLFNNTVPTMDLLDHMSCIKSKADRERIANRCLRESTVDANRELCSAFVGKTGWYDQLMAALLELGCEEVLKKMEADKDGSLRSSTPCVPLPGSLPPPIDKLRVPPQPTSYHRDHPVKDLPVGVKKAVCLLDQDKTRGWEALASRLGITWEEGNEVAMLSSPSTRVIEMWLQRDPGNATLGRLLDILERIERLDVVSEIETVLGWESVTSSKRHQPASREPLSHDEYHRSIEKSHLNANNLKENQRRELSDVRDESVTSSKRHQPASRESLSHDEYYRSIEKSHLYGNNLKENQRREPSDIRDQREQSLQYTLKRNLDRQEVSDHDLKRLNEQTPKVGPDLSYQAVNQSLDKRAIYPSVTPEMQEEPRGTAEEIEVNSGRMQDGNRSPSRSLHKAGEETQTSASSEPPHGAKENNFNAEVGTDDASVPMVKHADTTQRVDTGDQNPQLRSARSPATCTNDSPSNNTSQASPLNDEEVATQTQRATADLSPNINNLEMHGDDSWELARNLNQKNGRKGCMRGINITSEDSRITNSDNKSPVCSTADISDNPAASLSSVIVPECKSEDILVSLSSSMDSSCSESVKGEPDVLDQSRGKTGAEVSQTHHKAAGNKVPLETAPAVDNAETSKPRKRREVSKSEERGSEVSSTRMNESQSGGESGCEEKPTSQVCGLSDNAAANNRANEKRLEQQRLETDSQEKVRNKLISNDYTREEEESAGGISTDGKSTSSQQTQRGRFNTAEPERTIREEETTKPLPLKTFASSGDSSGGDEERQTLTNLIDNYTIDGTNMGQIDDGQETLQISSDRDAEIISPPKDVNIISDSDESPTENGVSPSMQSVDPRILGPQSLRSVDENISPPPNRWWPLRSDNIAYTLLTISNNLFGNNLTNEF